jgi:hypothetical protein
MHPGRKELTPHEKRVVLNVGLKVLEMWEGLYARNRWKPTK